MLHHLEYDLGLSSNALNINADNTWFYNYTLLDTLNDWNKQGEEILFIDELHKYPNRSVELKNI